MIYLDNAATSWPKPETVYAAADDGLRQAANPGRASHAMSIRAERIVEQTRASLALLIGAEARQVIWTQNATEALNLALKGLLKTGDHVITSSLEHNAVARPLEGLRRTGVEVEKIATDPVSGVSLPALEQAIRPGTRDDQPHRRDWPDRPAAEHTLAG
jgi:selenocysteine lyase/cysteine desulfurase